MPLFLSGTGARRSSMALWRPLTYARSCVLLLIGLMDMQKAVDMRRLQLRVRQHSLYLMTWHCHFSVKGVKEPYEPSTFV